MDSDSKGRQPYVLCTKSGIPHVIFCSQGMVSDNCIFIIIIIIRWTDIFVSIARTWFIAETWICYVIIIRLELPDNVKYVHALDDDKFANSSYYAYTLTIAVCAPDY